MVTGCEFEFNTSVVSSSGEMRCEAVETGEVIFCPWELEATREDEIVRIVGVRELAELACSTDMGLVVDLTSEDCPEIWVESECSNV